MDKNHRNKGIMNRKRAMERSYSVFRSPSKGSMNLVYAVFFLFFFTACSNNEWSKTDKNKLKKRCLKEGGGKAYCKCYLKHAMEAYPNAKDIDDIDFESAVELSIDC